MSFIGKLQYLLNKANHSQIKFDEVEGKLEMKFTVDPQTLLKWEKTKAERSKITAILSEFHTP